MHTLFLVHGILSSSAAKVSDSQDIEYRHVANLNTVTSKIHDILSIEYYSLQLRLNSLPIEALTQHLTKEVRASAERTSVQHLAIRLANDERYNTNIEIEQDKSFAKDALEAGRNLLCHASNMARQGLLKHAPQRIFTRIMFAATLLLKVCRFCYTHS